MDRKKRKPLAKKASQVKRPAKSRNIQSATNVEPKLPHPWRLCPPGEHWVRFHPRNIPKGGKTTVTGYCRTNSSKKDQIYALELDEIAKKHFNKLNSVPTADDLGYDRGNEYDHLIAGWTQ